MRLRGAAARWAGGHDATHGSCQRPWPATTASAACRAPRPGLVGVHRRRRRDQRLHDPPGLLDAVLALEARAVAQHRRVQQDLVRASAPSPPCVGELEVQCTCSGSPRRRRAAPRRGAGRPVVGSSLIDELVGLRAARDRVAVEAQPRRRVEDEPQLGLGDRQQLAGPDEERHAGPAPVVDLQPHGGVRLGRGVGLDPVDVAVAVVLAADVVRRDRRRASREQRVQRVLERRRVAARGRLDRGRGDDLHEVVDDDVAQRADGVVEVAAIGDAEVLGHRDLHRRDVVAVPHRLEQGVREPQVERLGDAHLPEEVVDPVQLGLVEVLVHLVVERPRGGEVVPERLLDDDARVLGQAGVRPAP